MERLLISKEWDKGYAFYTFKPKGYIENFFERSAGMTGIGFDKARGRWTAPARQESLDYLKTAFGQDCLVWPGGGAGAPGSTGQRRGFAPARKPAARNGGQQQPKPKQPPVELPAHWQDALHRTEEQLKVRRYSWRTVKSYLSHLRSFLRAHIGLELKDINAGILRQYIVARTESGNFAESTQNQLLNAIKFWLEQVEGREKMDVELRAKKREQLPTVLSVEEVKRLFAVIENLKHRGRKPDCRFSAP